MITEFQSFIEKYQDGNEVFLATDSKNQVWLRATEVCKKLEFTDAHRTVKTYLKDHQYQELRLGMGRPALYISESGFYKLILKSKSLIAENFIDWITEEVLPKLRASGGYIMPSATSEQLKALKAKILQKEAEILELKTSTQQAQLEAQRASEAAQKFLNYFWALNNFAFELLISVGHFRNPKYIAQFQKQEFLAQVWRKIEIALNFVCEHKETIQKLESQTVAYETCVNPELAQDRIRDFLKKFEK